MFSLTDKYKEMKRKRQMCCIVFTLCTDMWKLLNCLWL